MSISNSSSEKPVKIPGPDHPIAIKRAAHGVVVRAGGKVIADTNEALVLSEARYPDVFYIPRKDVDMSALERADHTTYCPYKGDCSYFSIALLGEKGANAVWTYENPYDAVSAIKEHLAFYPDRVDSITEIPVNPIHYLRPLTL